MKEEFTRKLNTKLGNRRATMDELERNGMLVIEEGMPNVMEDVPRHEQYEDDDENTNPARPIPEADETPPVEYDKYVASK
eukprot:scaffold14880_cov58-Cylindrotheca_fusiformis.AAC.1